MVLFASLVPFIFLFIASTSGNIDETQDETTQFNELLQEGNSIVALFTQACCTCTDCVEAEVLLGGMSKELEENLDLLVVRLKSEEMKEIYGVKRLPTLIYIRENSMAVYDGIFEFDTLYAWLQDNREPATVRLSDSTFEHLTQAATGATTGDWLVIFHNGGCCKKRELMYLETVGTKMRNKVNVASVNIARAPETRERFKITRCPEVIFFRHQKLYRFSLPDITTKTLKSFAEGFYKNSKAEPVPPPKTLFDRILDNTIKFINKNWYNVMGVLALSIICTITILIYFAIKPPSHRKSD